MIERRQELLECDFVEEVGEGLHEERDTVDPDPPQTLRDGAAGLVREGTDDGGELLIVVVAERCVRAVDLGSTEGVVPSISPERALYCVFDCVEDDALHRVTFRRDPVPFPSAETGSG